MLDPFVPPGFANIDELEDLVGLIFEEPGAYRAVDGQLWRRYRMSGSTISERDRYNVLREIISSLNDTSPALASRVLALYGNEYGKIPRIANQEEVSGLTADDPVFSGYVSRNRTGVRILPDGTPSDPNPALAPRQPVEGPAINPIAPFPIDGGASPNSFSPEAQRGPRFDPNSNAGPTPEQDSIDRDRALDAQERQEFLDDLNEQLRLAQSRLAEDQGALAAQFGLNQRSAEFNQVTGNLAGPVGPGVGNLFSGFQRQRRGLNNTRFGFDDAQRRLSYANALRSISRQRENNLQAYQEAIDAFDAQRRISTANETPIPGDEFFDSIESGDFQ